MILRYVEYAVSSAGNDIAKSHEKLINCESFTNMEADSLVQQRAVKVKKKRLNHTFVQVI